jgi:hypothetical protein
MTVAEGKAASRGTMLLADESEQKENEMKEQKQTK